MSSSCATGGLTSVLQVCDLCCNDRIKRSFKKLYMEWRAANLRQQRVALRESIKIQHEDGIENPTVKPLSLQRDRRAIINIVQRVFRDFNEQEESKPLELRVIHKTFQSVGQVLDADDLQFTEHLDKLSRCSAYMTSDLATSLLQHRQQGIDLTEIDRSLSTHKQSIF